MVYSETENDSAVQFIDQQDLVRIFTSQAIRRVHIQAIDRPAGRQVA
jgi:hypothetical protein